MVSPLLKKRPCRNGCVGNDRLSLHRRLQLLTKSAGNALPLIVLMDIQPVQVAGLVHIAKAYDGLPIQGNQCPVL